MRIILLLMLALSFSLQSCTKSKDSSKSETKTNTDVKANNEIQIPTDKSPLVINNLGPLESIKDLDRRIEAYKSGSALTKEDIEFNKKLKEEIIQGTFDLYELCRLALDIHWNSIDETQRKYFSDLMTRLLERKAIFSKEQVKSPGKPYKVNYLKEEYLDATKNTSLVKTKVVVPTEKVDLNINYKLIKNSRGWNIFDVIVDEASLVENYKFQFDTIIKKYGYQELVSRMEKKLKEME
jgi:phospholipid transport system substrate-binding protein